TRFSRDWSSDVCSSDLTKMLAKLANRLVKKTGELRGVVSVLDEGYRESALAEFPVSDVWGVGRGIRKSLELTGIRTAAQLRDARSEERRVGKEGSGGWW